MGQMMNRRFRAGELRLAEISENLAPVGNVDRLPSAGASLNAPLPPDAAPADTPSLDDLRVDALQALHTYLCAATGFDHRRTMVVFGRVRTVLDNHLDPRVRAGQANK